MTRASRLSALLLAALLLPGMAHAVSDKGDVRVDPHVRVTRSVGVEVWTDRGTDALYSPGDDIQFYVRVDRSAYVAIYDIDTRGRTHLLYPTDPLEERPLRAGKTYRFPRGRADRYTVDGPRGVEYIQVVASREPLYSRLPWDYRLLRRSGEWWGDDADDDDTWMYHVTGDPFVWCDRLNQLILDDDAECGSGFVSFAVDQRVTYPRYLCNECHVHTPYGWDPYGRSCSTFDVRVTAGWVYRPWGYRGRTCDPFFVYYRRDSCPPRYRELPRYWSSQERHRIREYFGPARVNGPLGGTGGEGGSAYEKDSDARRKSPDLWGGSRSGSGRGGADRGGATWKDGQTQPTAPRDRGQTDVWRRAPREEGSRGTEQRSPEAAKPAQPERRSWINNLIRGGSNKGWDAPERQPPSPRVSEPSRSSSPPPASPPRSDPPRSDPPRGKDADSRKK